MKRRMNDKPFFGRKHYLPTLYKQILFIVIFSNKNVQSRSNMLLLIGLPLQQNYLFTYTFMQRSYKIQFFLTFI